MIIQVKAHEIKDAEIQKVSMVQHGAIKTPFQILKTEDLPTGTTLKRKISKMLSINEELTSKVTAIFVKNEAVPKFIKAVETTELAGQIKKIDKSNEGYVAFIIKEVEEDVQLVALSDTVGIALEGTLSKGLHTYPDSEDFDVNVAGNMFFPSIRIATESLQDTIWNVMFNDDSEEESRTAVAKILKAFSNHVNQLVAALPQAVFKLEKELLQDASVSDNLGTESESVQKTGEENMSKSQLRESLAGDLDGLLDQKTVVKTDEELEAQNLKKEGEGEDGGDTVEAVATEGADTQEEDMSKYEIGTRKILKDGETVDAKYYYLMDGDDEIFYKFIDGMEVDETPPLSDMDKLMQGLTVVVKAVKNLQETVEKQDDRIEEVAKTATEASAKAGKNVVMVKSAGAQLDAELEGLNSGEQKSDLTKNSDGGNVWDGLLTQISG